MRNLRLLAILLVAWPLSCSCTLWQAHIDLAAIQTQARALDTHTATTQLDHYLLGLHDIQVRLEATEPPPDNPDWLAGREVARTRLAALLVATKDAVKRVREGAQPLLIFESLKNRRAEVSRVGGIALPQLHAFRDLFTKSENKLWSDDQHGLQSFPDTLSEHLLLPELRQRAELFERKYFDSSEDQSDGGNFVEGWLNSGFALFRSDQLGGSRWQDSAGVSPWEATARIEPVLSFDDSGEPGLLAAVGITRHLFPDRDAGGDFWTDYLQRFGARLGVGVVEERGETADLVFGAAIQLRSLTVWGLFHGEEGDVSIGIGSGDFRWLSEIVTQFD